MANSSANSRSFLQTIRPMIGPYMRQRPVVAVFSAIAIWLGIEFLWALIQVDPKTGVITSLLVLGIGWGIGAVLWRRYQHEQVQAQQWWAVQTVQSAEIHRYHAMDAREFEQALAFLCARDGCTDVTIVGGAGDLGADVIATAPNGSRIVIQAKRYGSTKVTGPDLQRFGGTCFSVHQADVAVVVTTSTFTRQARDYANHMGIGLFSEEGLAGWASRTGPAPWE